MTEGRKRYWVYSHDEAGDLIKDLGETDVRQHALDAAGAELHSLYLSNDLNWVTVRVVDYDLQDGTTIWLAGPVKAEVK